MVSVSRWRFNALDTWFFRESRPMESIGGSELQSTFPPSGRSVAGAIRFLVGQTHKVDWSTWKESASHSETKSIMGDFESYGPLRFSGPWLSRKQVDGKVQRLYPVSANLVAARDKTGIHHPVRMTVGSPYTCDLGRNVRMGEVAIEDREKAGDTKLKPLDSFWVSASTLQGILAGASCKAEALISSKELFDDEARLGIARNNMTRTVEAGMLYQTKHVRPRQEVSVEIDVVGLSADDHLSTGIVRLGGEGRGAAYEVENLSLDTDEVSSVSQLLSQELKPVSNVSTARGIILMLLTPMSLNLSEAYCPLPGFKIEEAAEGTVWKGVLQGVNLSLHCVMQGKAIREGGWDLANNRPRDVMSFAPSGSVYYLTVDNGDIQGAINAIHLTQIGEKSENAKKLSDDEALGRGLVAAGIWPKNEWVEKE